MTAKRNEYLEITPNSLQKEPEYFSFAELAERWRCSRGTVYNRLRKVRADILDFAPRGRKGKKVVSASIVFGIEAKHTRRLY
jgi:DNA-binding Lrp family transcriptional regulator